MKRDIQKKNIREADYNSTKRLLHKINKIHKKKEERDKQIKHYMIEKYVKEKKLRKNNIDQRLK